MSFCFYWSNKLLCVEVPLIFMLVDIYFIFLCLIAFLGEGYLTGFTCFLQTETDRLFSQKILPNFWHTAILTASVGNNNTDGRILKFHSFLDLRER